MADPMADTDGHQDVSNESCCVIYNMFSVGIYFHIYDKSLVQSGKIVASNMSVDINRRLSIEIRQEVTKYA